MALRANRFGRGPELVAKRPGEGFVRAIAGLERDGEDVGRAIRQTLCCLGQPASAHVAADGLAGGGREGAGQMETRHATGRGHLVERDVGGETTFDKPERLVGRIHDSSQRNRPIHRPGPRLSLDRDCRCAPKIGSRGLTRSGREAEARADMEQIWPSKGRSRKARLGEGRFAG